MDPPRRGEGRRQSSLPSSLHSHLFSGPQRRSTTAGAVSPESSLRGEEENDQEAYWDTPYAFPHLPPLRSAPPVPGTLTPAAFDESSGSSSSHHGSPPLERQVAQGNVVTPPLIGGPTLAPIPPRIPTRTVRSDPALYSSRNVYAAPYTYPPPPPPALPPVTWREGEAGPSSHPYRSAAISYSQWGISAHDLPVPSDLQPIPPFLHPGPDSVPAVLPVHERLIAPLPSRYRTQSSGHAHAESPSNVHDETRRPSVAFPSPQSDQFPAGPSRVPLEEERPSIFTSFNTSWRDPGGSRSGSSGVEDLDHPSSSRRALSTGISSRGGSPGVETTWTRRDLFHSSLPERYQAFQHVVQERDPTKDPENIGDHGQQSRIGPDLRRLGSFPLPFDDSLAPYSSNSNQLSISFPPPGSSSAQLPAPVRSLPEYVPSLVRWSEAQQQAGQLEPAPRPLFRNPYTFDPHRPENFGATTVNAPPDWPPPPGPFFFSDPRFLDPSSGTSGEDGEEREESASLGKGLEAGQSSLRNKRTARSASLEDHNDRPKKIARKIEVACEFCRGRKLRCDGQRPACRNCFKRRIACTYAKMAKRRGPGKAPKRGRNKQPSSSGVGGEDQSKSGAVAAEGGHTDAANEPPPPPPPPTGPPIASPTYAFGVSYPPPVTRAPGAQARHEGGPLLMDVGLLSLDPQEHVVSGNATDEEEASGSKTTDIEEPGTPSGRSGEP